MAIWIARTYSNKFLARKYLRRKYFPEKDNFLSGGSFGNENCSEAKIPVRLGIICYRTTHRNLPIIRVVKKMKIVQVEEFWSENCVIEAKEFLTTIPADDVINVLPEYNVVGARVYVIYKIEENNDTKKIAELVKQKRKEKLERNDRLRKNVNEKILENVHFLSLGKEREIDLPVDIIDSPEKMEPYEDETEDDSRSDD